MTARQRSRRVLESRDMRREWRAPSRHRHRVRPEPEVRFGGPFRDGGGVTGSAISDAGSTQITPET